MHSKPLSQAIDLALDVMGMQGEVTRRQVAEEVYRQAPDKVWSLADEKDAKMIYLMRECATRMRETLSVDYIKRYLPAIAPEHRALMDGIPRFICVSVHGGPHAVHVMSIRATPEQWQANAELKSRIIKLTQASRDQSRLIADGLLRHNASSLIDLCSGHRFEAREAVESAVEISAEVDTPAEAADA